MGQEILSTDFTQSDFDQFSDRLAQETSLLHQWFADKAFSKRRAVGGLELEGWLISPSGIPQPANEAFLERAANPNTVPELSKFNFELNADPRVISGYGLRRFEDDLSDSWQTCERIADSMGLETLAIGIPPTLEDSMLCLANMSTVRRYKALNKQLLRLREGKPIQLDIAGNEFVRSVHHDMMLEAGTTSFQVHLQVPQATAARYYNASTIASAPLVAVSANAPFLFGKQVWEETRIPLFEQAIAILGPEKRVTLGSRYVESLEEVFRENRDYYPVLLPTPMDDAPERMAHVRLHNGTLWRWNRPLVGFDEDGAPHLRIEHRVQSAGPTIVDMIANMAFYYGLVEWLVMEAHAPEFKLPFATARDNFYEAARLGMRAKIDWYDGKPWNMARLLQSVLLPQARKGLRALQVNDAVAERYLGIIEERVARNTNGATFQRIFAEKYFSGKPKRDFAMLVRAYRERQRTGEPVHTWTL